MKRHKPDPLLVLIAVFGLVFVLSAYTHANRQEKIPAVPAAIFPQP